MDKHANALRATLISINSNVSNTQTVNVHPTVRVSSSDVLQVVGDGGGMESQQEVGD